MRHGKKDNHLGRKKGHREALLSNMASSLLIHKRIQTTVAKAKELRKYVEPLITRAKSDTMHSRRMAFSYLQNKESMKALFGEVASRTAERPGGYTRIIKLGEVRLGDAAEMCLMELVDFNDQFRGEGAAEKKAGKTRRSRGKKSEGTAAEAPAAEAKKEEKPAKEQPKAKSEKDEKPKKSGKKK